jgi:hypothetical protein
MANNRNILLKLDAFQTSMDTKFDTFHVRFDGLERSVETRFSTIQSSIDDIKEDVSVLKKDVSVLKKDVSVLKKDVSVLKKDMDLVKDKLQIVEKSTHGAIKTLDKKRTNINEMNTKYYLFNTLKNKGIVKKLTLKHIYARDGEQVSEFDSCFIFNTSLIIVENKTNIRQGDIDKKIRQVQTIKEIIKSAQDNPSQSNTSPKYQHMIQTIDFSHLPTDVYIVFDYKNDDDIFAKYIDTYNGTRIPERHSSRLTTTYSQNHTPKLQMTKKAFDDFKAMFFNNYKPTLKKHVNKCLDVVRELREKNKPNIELREFQKLLEKSLQWKNIDDLKGDLLKLLEQSDNIISVFSKSDKILWKETSEDMITYTVEYNDMRPFLDGVVGKLGTFLYRRLYIPTLVYTIKSENH